MGITHLIFSESREVIQLLKEMKKDVWIMSGDNQVVTSQLGRELGVSENKCLGALLPQDKLDHIKRLQSEGHVVFMIGDGMYPMLISDFAGVNDSAALSQADVGVCVATGTDVSIEAANIVMTRSSLRGIFLILEISQQIFRRINLNFAWAFFYNLIGIPIACGVFDPFHISIPPGT